jgi:2-oxoglutarate dehydrogenase E1 component
VYYDLLAERRDSGITDVAILRLEQLYPFPRVTLPNLLAPYKNADVVWCQEEPANMGAWNFVDRQIEGVLTGLNIKAKRPSYVGRAAAASPATGHARTHAVQQTALVQSALALD